MGKLIAFVLGFILGALFGTVVGQFLWNKFVEVIQNKLTSLG